MALRIEIVRVAESDGRVTATGAFYFPVPLAQQSALAADAARVPAGTKLPPAELLDLRAGKIIEEVRAIDVTGFTTAQLRTAFADVWAERRPIAIASYVARHRLIGDTWADGTGWTNA